MRTAPLALVAASLVLPLGAGPAQPAAPAFDPITFFEGRTRGSGTLSIILRQPRSITVQGEGRVRRDGALILRQRVEQDGRPPRTRRWELRRTGPTTFAGTLTDATGPVQAETRGTGLRITYPSKSGRVEQWLTLAPDGRSARNRLTVRRLGLVVAKVDETIRKFG